MSTLADELTRTTSQKLHKHGYFHHISDDLRDWSDRVRAGGGFVFSHFDDRHTDAMGGQWVGIFKAETGEMSACLAWRLLDGADYMDMVERGGLYADDPVDWGHAFHETGLRGRLDMSGRVLSRGGIHSFEGGKGLSFYACTYAVAQAVRVKADIAAGIILPGTFLPFPWYGYWNRCDALPHKWPNLDQPMRATLAWSAKHQLRKEAEDRLGFLKASDQDNLKTTADAYARHQDAGK